MVWLRVFLGLLLFVGTGCLRSGAPTPGVSYSVSVITRDSDRRLKEEPARSVEDAVVEDVEELVYQGEQFLVQVRKTQSGQATFEITFPDRSVQMVQIRRGQSKNTFAKQQQVGIRIAVQEAH
jgi:hypothetical protein